MARKRQLLLSKTRLQLPGAAGFLSPTSGFAEPSFAVCSLTVMGSFYPVVMHEMGHRAATFTCDASALCWACIDLPTVIVGGEAGHIHLLRRIRPNNLRPVHIPRIQFLEQRHFSSG
jgi:hypothetical protein